MNRKTRILVHVALFWAIYSYVLPFLRGHIPIERFNAFSSLNELTGFPTLESRIVHFAFAVLLYGLFTVAWERENWGEAFFLSNSPMGLLKGAVFALLVALGALALFALTGLIDIQGIIPDHRHVAALILAWLVAQVFNAVQEELVFRGYILRRLAGPFNKHAAVAVSSLIFGLGHIAQYSLSGFIFATMAGAIYGYLFLTYRNIYVPIGMHGVWDICSHVLVNLKILVTQPGPLLLRLGVENYNIYSFAYIVAANAVFLVVFFVWRRLWRLR